MIADSSVLNVFPLAPAREAPSPTPPVGLYDQENSLQPRGKAVPDRDLGRRRLMAHDPAAPPGTRFPRKGDEALDFEAAGPLKGKLAFEEILGYHKPESEEYTLFRVFKREVAGAACFSLGEEDVRIDYLTRNGHFSTVGVSVGAVLESAVERIATLGSRELIRLDSMDDPGLLKWYRSRGFTPEGEAFSHPFWGTLHPMVKRVEPWLFG